MHGGGICLNSLFIFRNEFLALGFGRPIQRYELFFVNQEMKVFLIFASFRKGQVSLDARPLDLNRPRGRFHEQLILTLKHAHSRDFIAVNGLPVDEFDC